MRALVFIYQTVAAVYKLVTGRIPIRFYYDRLNIIDKAL